MSAISVTTALVVLALVVVLAIVEWREHRTGRHVASRGPNRALRVVEEPRAEPPGGAR